MDLKRLSVFSIVNASLIFSCLADDQESEQVPSSFVRDVMQPLGMPVVTTFHAVRESLFLNAEFQKGIPLETFGNLLLAPSRYVFAGKTIDIRNEEKKDFEIRQSYSYDNWHWLKWTCSLLILPVTEVLGVSIKGISYLAPEVRQKHNVVKEALQTTKVSSKNEEYQKLGIDTFHSEEFIPCQEHKRPSFLTKKQKIEINALKEIVSILEENNIVYWVDFGTCLGAFRYGGIIPWDWDIDIAILEKDHDNVKFLFSSLNKEKYQIQDWSSYTKPKTLLKLFVKETKNFIDIYHYHINEEKKEISYIYTYADSPFPKSWQAREIASQKPLPYEDYFPLKKATFDGLSLWAPNNVVGFLHCRYGENLDPVMVWDEATMTYKKVEDHPFWITE